jgi:hypothetical protein
MNIRQQKDRIINKIKRFSLSPRILFLITLICGTFLRAYLIVNRIKAAPHSPLHKAPPVGYLRGIDFYKGWRLIPALASAMCVYRRHHGAYPNLLKPRNFDEKLFKSKFFAEIKIPESGNKLLTSRFIPDNLKTEVGVAKTIWHSPIAKLPRNDEIMPGNYFLKASHGAGMFQKIRYPLKEDEFICLEKTCEKWLENKFGLSTGEWWYNTFQKEILIEEQVGAENNSISWHFYTFDGVIGHITAHRKSASDFIGEYTLFDEDFEIMAGYKAPRPVKDIFLTQDTKNQLRRYASLIGGQFRFVRVDFLVDNNQKIYLGELTFCPGNAANRFLPDELQTYLRNLWSES